MVGPMVPPDPHSMTIHSWMVKSNLTKYELVQTLQTVSRPHVSHL